MPSTKDTSEQRNKRVETKTFNFYDQAAAYKQLQLDSKKYSKVKVKKRSKGTYDVLTFVPLKGNKDA